MRKLLFLGSSCIYPKLAPQPLKEEYLLTGPLEPTNEPYAIAKIAGIRMCDAYNRQYGTNFIAAMPTNLYGPGDNYDPENSHVLPALIRRFHEAAQAGQEEVVVWGSGKPMREYLHVDDMAEASLFVLDLDKATYDANTDPMLSHINVGSGTDIAIRREGRGYRVVHDHGSVLVEKLLFATGRISHAADLGWERIGVAGGGGRGAVLSGGAIPAIERVQRGGRILRARAA